MSPLRTELSEITSVILVEKTLEQGASAVPGGKHLHGHGEDGLDCSFITSWTETPPRTWRRLELVCFVYAVRRNTSTDMEKTTDEPPIILDAWETPPRTWRRPGQVFVMRDSTRNTSTDVEKTTKRWPKPQGRRKHLHGRGEDSWRSATSVAVMETPPWTWRRRMQPFRRGRTLRNTSTDVEKTDQDARTEGAGGKHLHGRGEDRFRINQVADNGETPPRTWRRLNSNEEPDFYGQKHLHGRGEDWLSRALCGISLETPPRTWRRRLFAQMGKYRPRNTSTDVEKTALRRS